MKRTFLYILTLSVLCALLPSCRQTIGSVPAENVAEMLQSPRMAVTASLPGWVLEKRVISPLDAKEIAELRSILLPEQVRGVPEEYYRDPVEGNRDDASDQTFYIYASNAQCLGGRIVEGRAMMDDFNLSDGQQDKLTELLMPHLLKIGIVK